MVTISYCILTALAWLMEDEHAPTYTCRSIRKAQSDFNNGKLNPSVRGLLVVHYPIPLLPLSLLD
jgi:hypothetical protein